MRAKPATRYNNESEHNQFGIYNWFRNKGIKNAETMREVMYVFCESQKFKGLNAKTKERTICNFVGNRFYKFAPFAVNYMRENNYL